MKILEKAVNIPQTKRFGVIVITLPSASPIEDRSQHRDIRLQNSTMPTGICEQ